MAPNFVSNFPFTRWLPDLFQCATFYKHASTCPIEWPYNKHMAASRFASSQWETALLCNDVSHWLGAGVESPLKNIQVLSVTDTYITYSTMYLNVWLHKNCIMQMKATAVISLTRIHASRYTPQEISLRLTWRRVIQVRRLKFEIISYRWYVYTLTHLMVWFLLCHYMAWNAIYSIYHS